jgi:hypothetical protein
MDDNREGTLAVTGEDSKGLLVEGYLTDRLSLLGSRPLVLAEDDLSALKHHILHSTGRQFGGPGPRGVIAP